MPPPGSKRKALQEINLTQLPARSTVPKQTSTYSTKAATPNNEGSRGCLTAKSLEYQLQVEADKQRLACQRDRCLAREEAARAQEAREAEIAALRAEGLGDEDIEDFLDDPYANDSEDEPEPHPHKRSHGLQPQIYPNVCDQFGTGRIQENEFTFKATTAVVTAAAKPAMSNAVRRQTASSPAPLRSVTRDTVQPHDHPYASSPPPHPDSGAVDWNHKKQGRVDPMDPAVYRRHLRGLEVWRTYSERSGQALAHHQQHMHDHRRTHAGFPNIPMSPRKPAFNAAKFAHAAQALDEDEELDS
ncbi:hypothetical protein JB92DRAFT_3131876 [Gautieria morchelliformis]|nr:hypothetical protein JB92DRAFT_3131876 [Gautieria morchelliformis]